MLGLLGGTFDPIHRGHLDVAHAARHALGLGAVWLVPARTPPHRRAPCASAAHRFAMVAMAVAGEDALFASDLEMDTDGPSYTVDTLDRLAARGVDLEDVCLILGADAFREIPTWKAYPALLDRCHVAVVSRPGLPARTLRTMLPELASRMSTATTAPTPGPAIHLIDAGTAPVSSTDVRRRLADNLLADGLVAPAVAAHIRRHGLYREAVRSDSLSEEHA
jgi:nicotinate-nucleotide adenylyltransferase